MSESGAGAEDGIDADKILSQAQDAIDNAEDELALESKVKPLFLGKNGELKKLLRQIGRLPRSARPVAGQELNCLRAEILHRFEKKRENFREAEITRRLGEKTPDITLPGRSAGFGGLHPLTLAQARAEKILSFAGFETADGPEIESDYYNFTALNHPPDHPARSMHDTFYTEKGDLLRTHTSSVQVRHLLATAKPPVRAIAPGRVYRCDHDATHSPMFHQIEGIWVDYSVSFTDLKGLLGDFFRAFFDDENIETRFRPSFFPFTEPSAECDIRVGGGKWMEVAGCGMIHPNVLDSGKMESNCRGFAFGMGVERLAMLYYGVTDIRSFFENDLRFLGQFSGE
ncbi:MAG: phenylalanine--tRNA ligase subunit alpha [Candidatus Zeuxoniibacter abyssi]|nr:MAG: phenylalanine--tRNA ligase subunit alpha [Candidatus Persebacteraceae bacterium AB1(2)]